MDRVIFGVDPDLHGAISVFSPDRILAELIDTSVNTEKRIEPKVIIDLISRWICNYDIRVIYERGNPGKSNGAISIAVTNEIYGVWRGLTASYNIPLVEVSPYEWKGRFGLNTDQIEAQQLAIKTKLEKAKQKSINTLRKQLLIGTLYQKCKTMARFRAIELFPQWAGKLDLAKDHGRAEAILIGWYGVKKFDLGVIRSSV